MTDVPAAPLLPGLAPLAERYDAFILDLWGVIHDGVNAYPGAAETLARLKALGKATALLSNAPRRASVLAEGMARMGIGRDLYGVVMSSGEAVHHELATRRDPFYAALGRRLLHIGPERDVNVYAGLDYQLATHPDAADFVLNTGPVDLDHGLEAYTGLLSACAARRLPMVCANPDTVVVRSGKRVMCAGALARWYADHGLPVNWRGKPDPAIYALVLKAMDLAPGARVCVVGDGLETDMAGAEAAGLDAAFVTGGIHAEELGVRHGQMPAPERVSALLKAHGLPAVAALPAFVW